MKVLLDTHAFIWWDSEPEKLSLRARVACEDQSNELFLSVASVWEMQIKLQLGKFHPRLPLAETIADQQRTNGLQLLSISLDHVLAFAGTSGPSQRSFRPAAGRAGEFRTSGPDQPRFGFRAVLGRSIVVKGRSVSAPHRLSYPPGTSQAHATCEPEQELPLTWIVANLRWIMIMSGVLTATMILRRDRALRTKCF
jgi:PIN domain nuclease of toxin-antitoxin system